MCLLISFGLRIRVYSEKSGVEYEYVAQQKIQVYHLMKWTVLLTSILMVLFSIFLNFIIVY